MSDNTTESERGLLKAFDRMVFHINKATKEANEGDMDAAFLTLCGISTIMPVVLHHTWQAKANAPEKLQSPKSELMRLVSGKAREIAELVNAEPDYPLSSDMIESMIIEYGEEVARQAAEAENLCRYSDSRFNYSSTFRWHKKC